MPLRRTVRKLSSNLSIDTPIFVAAKAGLDSTVAAASARSMRFMVQFPPIAALDDERFARCSHLETVRLLRSRLKLAAAHLACGGPHAPWRSPPLCLRSESESLVSL